MALCSVKGIIQKATHCVPGMMLWKSQMIRAESKPHCWLDLQGESGHKTTEEVFRTIKLFSVLFLADIIQLYIFATINGVVSERPMFIFHLRIYVSQKENPIDRNCLKWILGRWFFVFLAFVSCSVDYMFSQKSPCISTLCHSAILKDDSFISFAFEKGSWVPSIY